MTSLAHLSELDLGSALTASPPTNPWMVLLLGTISGLLAFAFSNALRVVIARQRALMKRRGSASRLWPAVGVSGALVAAVLLANVFLGRIEVNGQGLLFGDDLFVVTRRPGFLPSYPNTSAIVKKGDPILVVRRDAGPDEIAISENRREVLRQELEFIKADALAVDPLVLREYTLAEGSLRELEERWQKHLDARDTLIREAPQQRLENEARRQALEKDAQAIQGELEQNRLSLESASRIFESGQRAMSAGLMPQDEFEKRRERVNVLRSRQEELVARSDALRRERTQTINLTSNTEGTYSTQLALRSGEIATLDRRLGTARQILKQAAQKLEEDKVRAAAQREKRLRQIQIQIDELNTLLDATETTLSARAPWDGVVGFREPSPATVRSDMRPLLVLFHPGKISTRIQLPGIHATVSPGEKLDIRLRALTPEAVNTTVVGELVERVANADGTVELRIACQPPPSAVRDLAMGNTIPVSVTVRRPDLLARLGLSWREAIVIICLLALAISELRLRIRQWRDVQASPLIEGRRAATSYRKRFDWGGDPSEFQEFVVGVGMVSRRIESPTRPSAAQLPSSPPLRPAADSFARAEASLSPFHDVAT
jgi:hypothetical protein